MTMPSDNPAGWISDAIEAFVRESPANTLALPTGERAWAAPLVAFSSGVDPLYKDFKMHVGPHHLTPSELMAAAFPGSRFDGEALSVISWILPQTEQTKADSRKCVALPSERWMRNRAYGEAFNDALRRHVVSLLAQNGIKAVAPVLAPGYRVAGPGPLGVVFTWSERHAAYAAGLGTFGLCDGLITAKGKAVRIGSVVADIRLAPSERPYDDHQAYCLFFSGGKCRQCIGRCPAGAISESGHDTGKCIRFIRDQVVPFATTQFGLDGDGCGLCQTAVPCESCIPRRTY